jgi:CRISPR/Cas system-associated exonuclease Cas4 (RecB family)
MTSVTPIKISNSEIQTYKDCKRRWWLTYYRRLKPKMKDFTGALALGSRIHEALDRHYSTGQDLLEAHTDLIREDMKKMTDSGRDTSSLETEADLGRVMLEGYLEWIEQEGIDAELEMISTEEILERPMMDGKVILQGKIDMRVRRKIDGARMIRDFKTVGGSFADFGSMAHMNEQVKTYMLLDEAQGTENGERTDGAIFTMLRKVKRGAYAKPPFYAQIEVRHNRFTLRSFLEQLEGTFADMLRTREALDAGESHYANAYPTPTKDCKWKCQFFAICPLFDDGSAAEAALSDSFEVSDPYGYYGVGDGKSNE